MTCICPRSTSPRTVQDPFSLPKSPRQHSPSSQHPPQFIVPNAPCQAPSAPYCRARRPALVPSNSFLSTAEAADLVRTRVGQPLPPPPDASLISRYASISSSASVDAPSSPDAPLVYEDGNGREKETGYHSGHSSVKAAGAVETLRFGQLAIHSKPLLKPKRKRAEFLLGDDQLCEEGDTLSGTDTDGEYRLERDSEHAPSCRRRIGSLSGGKLGT